MAISVQGIKFVIITPARDEEKNIEATISSLACQTVLPAEWVIVDDGSTDETATIISKYATQFPWIRVIRRPDRGFRKSGGGVVEAFYAGYNALRCADWEFLVKLDGDLSFAPDYFERCLQHFRVEPRLGIGGGDIYHDVRGELKLEQNPTFHVRGATKIYRKACWQAIGGLHTAPGWDTIDEIKANMLGWETHSFQELHVLQHRMTGSAEGLLRDKVKHGVACYISGYHPIFVIASCLRRITKKPYLIGSMAIGYGYLKSYFMNRPRVDDMRMIYFLRSQQMRRLLGVQTIWK